MAGGRATKRCCEEIKTMSGVLKFSMLSGKAGRGEGCETNQRHSVRTPTVVLSCNIIYISDRYTFLHVIRLSLSVDLSFDVRRSGKRGKVRVLL